MYLLELFNFNIFCDFFIIKEFLWWRLNRTEISCLIDASKFFILLLLELLLTIVDRNCLIIFFILILVFISFIILLHMLLYTLLMKFILFLVFILIIIVSLLFIYLLHTPRSLVTSASIIRCCPLWSLQLRLRLILSFMLCSTTRLFLLLICHNCFLEVTPI